MNMPEMGMLLEHKSVKRNEPPEFYHYRESGLDDIWLAGGFSFEAADGEQGIRIEHCEELHEAIALGIIHRPDRITGRELRFLRHELGLTQADLARLLDADVQSVARWERGRAKAPGPADRLIRFLYTRRSEKDRDVMDFLEELAALDRMVHGRQVFHRTETGWKVAAA